MLLLRVQARGTAFVRSLSLSLSGSFAGSCYCFFVVFAFAFVAASAARRNSNNCGVRSSGWTQSCLAVIVQVRNLDLFKAYPRDKLKIGFKF